MAAGNNLNKGIMTDLIPAAITAVAEECSHQAVPLNHPGAAVSAHVVVDPQVVAVVQDLP
jgi:hypothetical protein